MLALTHEDSIRQPLGVTIGLVSMLAGRVVQSEVSFLIIGNKVRRLRMRRPYARPLERECPETVYPLCWPCKPKRTWLMYSQFH